MHSNISIIITAAGSSTRMGGSIKKEYLPYKDGTVLSNCAKTFLKAIGNKYNLIHFIITVPAGQEKEAEKNLFIDKELKKMISDNDINVNFVSGGDSRQKSVFNGLQYIKNNGSTDLILIHDGARPFVTEKIINDVIHAVMEYEAAVPGITPTDTIKQIDETGLVITHLVRKQLFAVQTPQGFSFEKLYDAHVKASKENYDFTDDTEIWGTYVGKVMTVPGSEENIKITYPQDLQRL